MILEFIGMKSGGERMILTVMGSCANQILNREGVSLFVEDRQDNLLIDCGPGIVAAFGRCYRRTSDVNSLLLTHVHADHIAGFPYFVWNRNFERMGSSPADDLHVFGEKETISLAKHMLDYCYPELTFPFEIFYHDIVAGEDFNCGALYVKTMRADHAVPCISSVIECKDRKIVYTSDSLYNESLVSLAQNADLLVHEGMMIQSMSELAKRVKHSTALEAGEFAKNINAKQLLLVHIAPGLLGKESTLIREANSKYDGVISIPHDGSVYGV